MTQYFTDTHIVIATANTIKEARAKQKAAIALMGFDGFSMNLSGSYADTKDGDGLFPGIGGCEITKIGNKYLTIVVDGETLEGVSMGRCNVRFQV